MNYRFGFFMILFTLLTMVGRAQQGKTTNEFSVTQAVEFAWQNQSNMKNMALDEAISKSRVKEIVGMGLPQINASATIQNFIELPTSLIPAEFFGGEPGTFIGLKFGTKYSATGAIEVSQLLFDGTYLVGLQASRTYQDLSRKMTSASKIEVTEKVMKAYYNCLVTDERKSLLDANVIRIEKLLNDTKVMYDNGFVERIDYNRIQVTHNNLKTEQKKIERLVELNYLMLKFQMGMDVKEAISLSDRLESINLSEGLTAEKFDFTKRIEYDLLQTQYKLMSLDLKKNRYSAIPSLVAFGSLSTQAQRDKFDIFDSNGRWYATSLIGAKLSIPIFSGMQRYQRIQQSKFVVQKVENEISNTENGLNLQYEGARTMLINSMESVNIQKENMQLAEEIYRVSKIKYEQGVGSNLEVVTAETSLKEAQTNYYSAMYDALISSVDLKKALGTLAR